MSDTRYYLFCVEDADNPSQPATNNVNWVRPANVAYNAIFTISTNTQVAGYIDISTIRNWYIYGDRINRDYKFIRQQIKLLVIAIGWDSMTLAEKQLASQYFVVPIEYRTQIYTLDEQIKYGKAFHLESIKTRDHRIARAMGEIMNRLIPAECYVILEDLYTSMMILDKYVQFGREGTLEGDPDGLFDYVESRAGTMFAGAGFREKGFTPLGFANMTDFSTFIMDIVKNGDFNVRD